MVSGSAPATLDLLDVTQVARRKGKDGIYENSAGASAMGDDCLERSPRVAEVELESVRNHCPKSQN